MSTEGRTIHLASLSRWTPFAVPLLTAAFFVIIVLVPADIPEIAYLLSDPVGLPAIAGSSALVILTTGLFTGYPFTPRPAPGAPKPSARWGLRVALAAFASLSFVVLRPVVIHGATPTREAVNLLRRHAIAGKKIGTPVEVGWGVRGFIHPSGDVNDEPVPARIDASVPVSGPRGSGVLSIEGHAQGSRWVFDRVSLRLDKGGERIDIVGVRAPPPLGGESSGIDPTMLAVVGGSILLAALLTLAIMLALRSSDPDRAVASIEAPPDAPFTLRFTPREPRPHRIWIRYELDYPGMEDDYGVTADLQIQVPSSPPIAVEHRIGDIAVALGPNGTTCTTRYRVTSSSGSLGNSIRATAEITTLPAATPGLEVVITGRLVLAAGTKPMGLLVFVVPA